MSTSSSGFTLAEAAITIAIVALVLMSVLQGLEGAKVSAFHTRQKKIAYELGTGMLGEITAGQWREEMETGMEGNFAEQDHPNFFWELALGEDVFEERESDEEGRPFDNFAARREWDEDNRSESEEDEDEEDIEEPLEKIRIRITFPAFKDLNNELVLETWAPWQEIYGPSEEDIAAMEAAAEAGEGDAPGAGGAGGGGQQGGGTVTQNADGTITAGGGSK